jgi:hypothetical protein
MAHSSRKCGEVKENQMLQRLAAEMSRPIESDARHRNTAFACCSSGVERQQMVAILPCNLKFAEVEHERSLQNQLRKTAGNLFMNSNGGRARPAALTQLCSQAVNRT